MGDSVEEVKDDVEIGIGMSAYEWHLLLKELEHAMCIVNRDQKDLKMLWNKIANKLNGSYSE